ncbi:transcription termination factor 1 [Tiliqua scincoides]|uniref:transcription termination factor 1 n=1 Tax=Tiliqua scincoides TaxID=71010 RepID=UPI003462F99D
MAELSDFQLPASKKKRRKRELGRRLLNTEAAAGSPWSSDRSFVFSGHDDEDGEAGKMKEEQKATPDPQLDDTLLSVESEVTSEGGTGLLTHKKKKKRKQVPVELSDSKLRVHVSQEEASSSPRTDLPENLGDIGHVDEKKTPMKKKKRAKALFTGQVEANSPSKRGQIEPSGPEDTEEELFTSTPLTPNSSLLFQLKRKQAINLVTPAESGSPRTEKKSRKKRKGSRAGDSDTTSSLAVEEGVDNTERDSQQPGSSPNQGASEGNNRSANFLTPVHKAEDGLPPPGCRPSQVDHVFGNPFLKSSEISRLDLDTATQELEVFIPHARNLSASAIKQLAQRDLIRFKNFQQEGVAVKFGKFSQKEDKQLKTNVEAFLEASGIESAEKLFFPDRFPEEKLDINKLKARHLFGVRIAEGIPRPWRLVYSRARKIFDPQNSSRQYSKKEIKKLKKYQAMYGNNWKKISELMHRSSHSVQMKYSQIKSKPNSGPWRKEEIKQLIQAVEEVIRSKGRDLDSALGARDADKALSLMREHLYKGISWTQVEAKVGTRHWRQCKHKWMSIVTKRMSRGERASRGAGNLYAKINLIERMYELNVEDANEIDWEDLSSAIGNVPPDYVQRRFYKLKAQHVPAWNHKHFPEIIDHLYEVTLPKFKNRLMKLKVEEEFVALKSSQRGHSDQKRTYKFSDIFWFSDDDVNDEEEKEEEELKSATSEVDPGCQKDSGSS